MNQELEQYLRFFMEYKQRDWPEWLATVEFAVNNKVHSATRMSLFMENYRREIRMGVDIRRKGKIEKVTEFVERIRRVQKEAGVALRKVQDEMRKQTDRRRREVEEWKKGEKVILSTKNLVFKERPTKN